MDREVGRRWWNQIKSNQITSDQSASRKGGRRGLGERIMKGERWEFEELTQGAKRDLVVTSGHDDMMDDDGLMYDV